MATDKKKAITKPKKKEAKNENEVDYTIKLTADDEIAPMSTFIKGTCMGAGLVAGGLLAKTLFEKITEPSPEVVERKKISR